MGSSSSEWDRDFELFDQNYEDIVSGIFCMTESKQEKQSSEHKETEITFIQVGKYILKHAINTAKLIFFIPLFLIPMSLLAISVWMFFTPDVLPQYALENGLNEMLIRWIVMGVGLISLNVVLTAAVVYKLYGDWVDKWVDV